MTSFFLLKSQRQRSNYLGNNPGHPGLHDDIRHCSRTGDLGVRVGFAIPETGPASCYFPYFDRLWTRQLEDLCRPSLPPP